LSLYRPRFINPTNLCDLKHVVAGERTAKRKQKPEKTT